MAISKITFKTQWNKFRKEVLEIDNYTCVSCGRNSSDNVVLQVHHKIYKNGKLPWEYKYSDCETLCKKCHAELHGKIPPSSGWTFHYYDDFGEISEQCEYCNTDIRYVFYISHPNWEPLSVGTICCDQLTSTKKASKVRKQIESYKRRLKSFIESPRWVNVDKLWFLEQKDFFIEIFFVNEKYQLVVNSKKGKLRFRTLNEAKSKIFSLIEDGSLEEYFYSR